MSAAALLREAAQAGVAVRLVDGKPKVSGVPSPDLLVRLRAAKGQVVELLTGGRCRLCGELLAWPGPAGLICADGSAECAPCADREAGRTLAAAERVTAPEFAADQGEVMLRGEIA